MKDKIKWPAGNRLDLCIPLRKITVTEEGTQFGEYIPSQAAVVMVYLVGNYASYEYTPRIEDNKLFITDNGELKPGVYAIDVRIQEPERKLRSFRCGELEIVRETKQLALGDFVLDNNITLDADAFIFGEGPSAYEVAVRDGYTGTKAEWLESMRGKEGRGIADIVALPTGAFRILLTDGSAYVTPILKGEQGVSIVDFTVSSITSHEVLCTITMSDGTTRTVNLPRGEKGEQGDAGEDGRGIQSVVMNNDYTITFSYTDGTSYTTPQALRGEQGENGQDGQDGQDGRGISSMSIDEDNHLTVSYTDGTTYTTPQSLQGERGVSITDFEQVGENATMCFFNIYYSNGNISQIGLPKGEQGDRGEQGPQGPKGDTVVLGEVGEYKLYNTGGTATDGAMTQDATTKAIAANNGYYECGTAAGTAAKVAVGDNEALYSLQKGGSIKVKMTNANAAASGVTLKIGSSAATPLYYNGEAVSASNTWESGEVISVYYDGTEYQATNAKVGSGKAADMKYDNSQSGLSAENVQGALDEVGRMTMHEFSATKIGYNYQGTEIGAVAQEAQASNIWMYAKINVKEGDKIEISGGGGASARLWYILDEDDVIIDVCPTERAVVDKLVLTMPSGAVYFVVNTNTEMYPEPKWNKLSITIPLIYDELGDNTNGSLAQKAATGFLTYKKEIEISQYGIVNDVYIQHQQNKWASVSGNGFIFVPVEAGCVYEVIAASTGNSRYAFLTTNEYTIGNTPSYATGSTLVNVPASESSGNIVAPEDARYLYIYIRGASVVREHRLYSVKTVKEGIVECHNKVSEIQEELSDNDFKLELSKNLINRWMISANGKWEMSENPMFYFYYFEAKEGDKFKVKTNAMRAGGYAWLNSLERGNNQPADFAVNETLHSFESPDTEYTIVAPKGTHYLYVLGKATNVNTPQSIVKVASIPAITSEIYNNIQESNNERGIISKGGNRIGLNPLGCIFTNAQAGDTNIYFPMILRPRHEGALGKYYMYYSNDHLTSQTSHVGIKLAYSDDLMTWTVYGNVMKAKDVWPNYTSPTERETESPFVVWSPIYNKYIMYWQSQYDYENTGYAQNSYICTSDDGIEWTYYGVLFNEPLSHFAGNGHDGYFTPLYVDGRYFANILFGGGSGYMTNAYSDDGLKWIINPLLNNNMWTNFKPSGTRSYNENEIILSILDTTIVKLNGTYYRIGGGGEIASGTAPKNYNLFYMKMMDDMETPAGDAVLLKRMDGPLETNDIRATLSFIDDDGKVYITWNCKSGDSYTSFHIGEIFEY